MNNIVFVSKSGMFTFDNCPRQYKYGNLLHLEPDEPNAPMSAALSDGIRYHELFATAFNFEEEPEPDRLFDQMFPGQNESDTILQMFVAREKERLKVAKFWRPVGTEIWIEDKSTMIRGAVDRVDMLNNSEYVVIDYKPKSYESRVEIAVYATILKSLGIDASYGAIRGYRTNKLTLWKIMDKDYKDMQIMMNNVFEAIEHGEFPKNDHNCMWCSYKRRCLEDDLINDDY